MTVNVRNSSIPEQLRLIGRPVSGSSRLVEGSRGGSGMRVVGALRRGPPYDYAARHPYYYGARLPQLRSRYGSNSCCKLFFCPNRYYDNNGDMGFCSCTVKYLLFFFNFIIVLCGVAIIAIGVMVSKNGDSLNKFMGMTLSAPAIALIVVGAIIFIIAFFGCCGAIRDSSCMVTTYAIFLLTILVIEVAIGVLVFVYNKDFKTAYQQGMEKLFDEYKNDKSAQEAVDSIQIDFQCCGLDSPSFWDSRGGAPNSCCRDPKGDLSSCPKWTDGCVKNVKENLSTMFKQLGGVAIGVACIEVIGVIFALCLASSIRRNEKRGYV